MALLRAQELEGAAGIGTRFPTEAARSDEMSRALMLVAALVPALPAAAAEPRMVPALFATETHVVRFDATGKQTLKIESGVSRDVWELPDGNILFPVNFYEVNRGKQVVWRTALTREEAGIGHGLFLLDEKPPFLR
jgi:hypothetical protein